MHNGYFDSWKIILEKKIYNIRCKFVEYEYLLATTSYERDIPTLIHFQNLKDKIFSVFLVK